MPLAAQPGEGAWASRFWIFTSQKTRLQHRCVSALVELVGVSKRYGNTVALYPTDLSIERGKTIALIGPSGCGKSTLLRLVVGLLTPDEGKILFDGAPVEAATVIGIQRRTGYVIQEGGLFPHLTARGNVLLMGNYLRKPQPDLNRRLAELCRLTRFPEQLLDRYPSELSGGQRQRISLMRALMLEPELLLLDEPLGALDPLVRAGLQLDLKQIFDELNQTVLLVTHDLAESAFLGHRIVLMNEGKIVQQGTLDQLRREPASSFVSDFINAQRTLVTL